MRARPRALAEVPRGWWGIDLPGYREAEAFATYERFDFVLPPVGRELDDDLDWLRQEAPVPASLAGNASSPDPFRSADERELIELLDGRPLPLPPAFRAFVADPDLRTRVRSCTACYLDLGEVVVPAFGGALLHFLSDQQWVLHWLLYVGEDGSEAVVSTDVPYGFADAPEPAAGTNEAEGMIVCAESFSEFLYRFWIENEIWFALADLDGDTDATSLTVEQRRYVDFYAGSGD